ncbi:MAG: DUF4129 domain-containing protein [Methylacidiphilales bacterium]|nr:DUF4129 domain-containing protein [Candidatus Methylacidiphilales bacterium]
MKWTLLALVLAALGCLGARPARAADDSSVSGSQPTPVTDPAQVAARYHAILQKPEFHDSGEVDVDERFRDMLTQWFFKLGKKMSQFKYVSEMSRVASIMLTGMVILCFGGVIYVIMRVYRSRAELSLDNAVDTPGRKTFRSPEVYEMEIQEAIRADDWHAAWLAAWRQFLSRLENRQVVEADRTRTNREYLAQLRQRALPSPTLALLTIMVDAYDCFIYGHRPITESDWHLFHQQVSEVGLLLHLDDKNPLLKPTPP